jgi:pimeloyl-ACP methyl ester carboxylesterase
MQHIWILFFIAIALKFVTLAEAQSTGFSVTTSHVDVVDNVGGALFTLNGKFDAEPRTMVVFLGGSEGGYMTVKSQIVMDSLMAGHRVAAIGYHGATGTPKHLSEISIDAIVARIKALGKASGAPSGCIGVIGISKGGELALLLASLSDAADVYVANTPSDVVWQASNPSLRSKSSWTYSGEPLPFVKYPKFSRATYKALRNVGHAGDLHSLALRKAKNLETARIPIEQATAPILLQAGSQDALWPTELMAKRLIARLTKEKPDHKVKLEIYELDHYLTRDAKVRTDALAFLKTRFTETCQ